MQPVRTLYIILIVVALTSIPAAAQNLVSNPTFDTETAPWEAFDGLTLTHTASDGFLGLGAAEVEGLIIDPTFGNNAVIEQCVSPDLIDPSQPIFVQAAINPVNFQTSQHLIILNFFEDDACSGTLSGDSQSLVSGGLMGFWIVSQGNLPAPLPPNTGSIRVLLAVFTGDDLPGAITRFDDVFVGTDNRLFIDGFESGDTSRWSNAVP